MAKSKRINILTLERAQHEDLLRGDAFTMASTLEILRGLHDDQRWPMTLPGYVVRSTATATPLRAHVLGGLLVRPDNNTYLTVDDGALAAAITPANSDDSILELVDDPGVTDPGALVFVANAAGDPRLDIVEVSVVDTALETTTRGVFNTTTRNFVPTSVDKVQAPRLSYRIRQGTAGAGLPAAASGWLALAVISHPPASASFADCIIWDVRPLVADRVQFGTPALDPLGSRSKFEQPVDGRWRSNDADGVEGYALSQFNGYLAGGQLLNMYSTFTAAQDPAFAMTANTLIHLVAAFPGGLPRWVKYAQTGADGIGGLRVPVGIRGIPVFTNDQPKSDGRYDSVTLATELGFTSDAPGVALVTLMVDNTGTHAAGTCVGRKVSFGLNVLGALPGIAGVASNQVKWTFSPRSGVIVPAHARSIDLEFQFTTSADGYLELFVKKQTGDTDGLFHEFISASLAGGTTGKVTVRNIPLNTGLPWVADGGGVSAQTYIQLNSQAALSACVAYVVGYSL
jgi:hypothetical protein